MNSFIFFNLTENNWILQSIRFRHKYYKMNRGDDDELPIGRKIWEKIDGDEDKVDVTLTISSCRLDEFTCDSGQCVPLT